MLLTEKDITGVAARSMREEAGLTQTAFWEPLGVKQSVGCRYESDIPIPHAVRILIVALYVAGLRINVSTPEGVKEASSLGLIQANFQEAKRLAAEVRSDIDRAAKKLASARDAMASI